jgi:hypothetical protein
MRTIDCGQSECGLLFRELCKMVAQMMLVERILLQTVEERNFHLFILRESVKRIVSLTVLEFDLREDLTVLMFKLRLHMIELRLIVDEFGFDRLKCAQELFNEVEISLSVVSLWSLRLFKGMLLRVPVVGNTRFRVESDFIQ